MREASLEKKGTHTSLEPSSGRSATGGALLYVFSFSPWTQAQQGGVVTSLQIWKAMHASPH